MSRATFRAACCLAMAATSLARAQPPSPGQTDAPDQAAEQQPPPDAQEPNAAPADQPDTAGDQATSAAEADSMGSDMRAMPSPRPLPSWLVGRWCTFGHERFTILDAHRVRFSDAHVYAVTYVVDRDDVVLFVQIPSSDHAIFFADYYDPQGEPSLRVWPNTNNEPLVRC